MKIRFLNHLSVSNKLLSITFFFCAILISVISYTVITLRQQKADSTVIDIAGRQRMLTQKYTLEVLKELEIRQSLAAARQLAGVASTQILADRAYYSNKVAAKIQRNNLGIGVSANHHSNPNKIPLPATFVQEVSASLDETTGYKYRLASKWNINPGKGLKTDFERRAWNELKSNPGTPYFEIASSGNGAILHYATADRGLAGCVPCHNQHPESPKQDYIVGELMGILAVTAKITDDPELAKLLQQKEEDRKPEADMTAKLFEISQHALRMGGLTYSDLAMKDPIIIPANNKPEIENKLAELTELWQKLRSTVDSIRATEINTGNYFVLLNRLTAMSKTILDKMHQTVGMMAEASTNKVNLVIKVEWIVLAFALLLSTFF